MRLEEPNYEARLKGFSTASRLVREKQLPIDQIFPVLYNCLFYVTQSDDMSIRDSAGSCLLAIVKTVARDGNKKEFNELILSCVVPACKLALRSNNEVMINHY